MDDAELIKIAAFKVGEGADRVAALAMAAASPRIRRQLLTLSNLLLRQKETLHQSLTVHRHLAEAAPVTARAVGA